MAAAIVWAMPAPAQMIGQGGPGISHKPQDRKKSEPLAPGVPGATSNPANVAPPSKDVGELSPNDALFDAINRGDIGSARDAIARGADLAGRNVLGLTPLDEAIDLGRNDISFLLLSLRDAGTAPATAAGQPSTGPAGKVARTARAGRRAPTHGYAATTRQNQGPAPTLAVAAPRTPRVFAGDGGTPKPNAGFLGFGPAQTSATP